MTICSVCHTVTVLTVNPSVDWRTVARREAEVARRLQAETAADQSAPMDVDEDIAPTMDWIANERVEVALRSIAFIKALVDRGTVSVNEGEIILLIHYRALDRDRRIYLYAHPSSVCV